MMAPSPVALAHRMLSSRRMSQAVAELIVLCALLMPAMRATLGTAGMAAAIATLLALAIGVFAVQREEAQWFGVLPVTLGSFFVVVAASITWTIVPRASVEGIAETGAFVAFGLYLALLRDAVQVVRAIGNATRVVLAASAIIEVANGLVLPEPVAVLGNAGSIAAGGPITGVLGSPTALAFTALLALVVLWIEWRGHMAPRENLAAWIALALGMLVLTRSTEAAVTLGVLIVALALTAGLRRLEPRARLVANATLAVGIVLVTLAAVAAPVSWFAQGAGGRRDRLWGLIEEVADSRPTLGWGWVGRWPDDGGFPYLLLGDIAGDDGGASASSSYLDVRLQLGLVGLVTLLIALGVALVRAWLVASARRSAVHHWPMLTLGLVCWWSFTSSLLTTGIGVLLLVAAAMSATRNRSWRQLITAPRKPARVS